MTQQANERMRYIIGRKYDLEHPVKEIEKFVDDLGLAIYSGDIPLYGIIVENSEGKIIGYAGCDVQYAGVVFFHIFCIDPDYENTGLAPKMGVKLLEYLQERGYTKFEGFVEKDNEAAVKFFKKLRIPFYEIYTIESEINTALENAKKVFDL